MSAMASMVTDDNGDGTPTNVLPPPDNDDELLFESASSDGELRFAEASSDDEPPPAPAPRPKRRKHDVSSDSSDDEAAAPAPPPPRKKPPKAETIDVDAEAPIDVDVDDDAPAPTPPSPRAPPETPIDVDALDSDDGAPPPPPPAPRRPRVDDDLEAHALSRGERPGGGAPFGGGEAPRPERYAPFGGDAELRRAPAESRRRDLEKLFGRLRLVGEINLADTRPSSKPAEIPGYMAKVYQSGDKIAQLCGVRLAIDGGRMVRGADKVVPHIFHDPIHPKVRKNVPANDEKRRKQDRGSLMAVVCGEVIARLRCGAKGVVICREGCDSTGDAWTSTERDVYDELRRLNVVECICVRGVPAEVTAAAVAATDPDCVADTVDHSDCCAASVDGCSYEFVCQSACGAGWYSLEKVRTNYANASLRVVTFSLEGTQIGPDHALALCACLLRDDEARHERSWSLVSLVAGVRSDSLKRLDREQDASYVPRTKMARVAREKVMVVFASALSACSDPLAKFRSMLTERSRAVDVTSSPPPFNADLRGDAALAKCSAGNREGRDAGPRLVASRLYFLEGTVQSRVPSLRGRVFNFEFYDVVFAPHSGKARR
ncbi:unnamed protein product [Pelagomonas calceolata]|uniref:Uncharacterized protein n=2 Tax=Pelagomonas calceolata TaxID=35677 RepID=A0A8J2SUG5_9STRA|nr:unnamed protein product [Pelagomonas calceolata]